MNTKASLVSALAQTFRVEQWFTYNGYMTLRILQCKEKKVVFKERNPSDFPYSMYSLILPILSNNKT